MFLAESGFNHASLTILIIIFYGILNSYTAFLIYFLNHIIYDSASYKSNEFP